MIDFKYIDSRETPGTHLRRRATEVAARDLGLTLIAVGVDKPEEFKQGFARIISDRADAVLETGNSVTYEHMRQIIDFAARQRLPAIYTLREFAESGGLMSYGSNFADRMRRAATFVEKILKGTKPADMPFQQPTKYELVINLKTARALDLSIPHSLLLRADEVIE